MRKYKIGEIARLLGSTTQTLRFYEQEGVLDPQKSENGTRFFAESDIVRLMAFKRFQLLDFSVQDVANHFKRGKLDSLLVRMKETSAHLKQESRELLRRAQAIDNYERFLRGAQQGIGSMSCVVRPAIYLHRCTLGELDRLDEPQRASFEAFMNAMPASHICFLYDAHLPAPLQFHFAISEEGAREWQLPLEDALCLPSGQCVRLFVSANASLWDAQYLNQQIARVKAAGYAVDESQPVIGQQLVSEHTGREVCLLAALYVPLMDMQA